MPATLVIRIPDPCLVVLVGAAGAGKSTFAARHFAPDEVLSSDAYRGIIGADPSDQRATGPAFAALHRALRRRLGQGRLTVVDATSVTAQARRALLREATAAGVPAIAIVLDLPPAEVHARNAARPGGAAVPGATVATQLARLGRSLADGALEREGFALTWRLRTQADIDGVSVSRTTRRSA